MDPQTYIAALEERIARMSVQLARAEAHVHELEAKVVAATADADALRLDHTVTPP